jgi:predicted adenine nucleotide alpha hydrolase (AANH) superfamily ATPase
VADVDGQGEQVLLHVCCGPCAIHPYRALVAEGFRPVVFFYGPNIQPFREYERRLEALREFGRGEALPLLVARDYRPEEHLRATLELRRDRTRRCRACYDLRLTETARRAESEGIRLFTTTLLVSPRQLHEEVRLAGERAAGTVGDQAGFLYRNFRPGYRESVTVSRAMGLYRQPYCGCLWSEAERYARRGT